MRDLLVYGGAALAVWAVWVAGMVHLDVFTPDDVRAYRRLAALRGYANPRTRTERVIGQVPAVARLQRTLDVDQLLAVAGRTQSALGFLGRSLALSLGVFAATLLLDVSGREAFGDWPLSPWLPPLLGVLTLLAAISHLRRSARRTRESIERTLGDMLMSIAVLTDSRGLQLNDAVRVLSRCASEGALEQLIDRGGWRRLITAAPSSTQHLYRQIAAAYGLPLFNRVADADAASHVGVPEREVYTRLAESVYRERLAAARARAARAKVLVTLSVAAMLLPLLLLLGAPALHAISSGLQGG